MSSVSSEISSDLETRINAEELKRRKREGLVILVTTLMVLLFAVFEVRLPEFSTDYSLTNNIAFFLLINLNITLLLLLIFLVVRNLVKLAFERKRGILGSRLRVRLVLAFVGLSLIPTFVLFAIAGGLVTRSFDRWFDVQVENALQGSLEIGETYYLNSANNALFYARQLSRRITEEGLFEPQRFADLKAFIQAKQREYNLGTVEIFSPNRELLVVAFNDEVPTGVTIKPESDFLKRVLRGLEVTRTQEFGEADIIRGGVPVWSADRRILGVVVVDYFVPKSISKRALQISRSYEEHKNLQFLQKPVKNSYILTLLLITLVITFSAVWFGLYLAKGITVPIQKLAEGTHEVAHGNWDYRIAKTGDDEIGMLVDSFNQMTRDLKRIHSELEQRKHYMETLLANIAAGVLSVDPAGIVTTLNKAAKQMLGLGEQATVGRHYTEFFGLEHLKPMRELMDQASDQGAIEREVRLAFADEMRTLMVTAATLKDDEGKMLGLMVFLEDITQIQKVQRMEAWREVARRIAHEIKNPLTPIQLSAQRLRKRYAGQLATDGEILEKCTSTIIKEVEGLKKLVNEFANFARLPAARMTPSNLNQIASEALFLFKEGHKGVQFRFAPCRNLPLLDLDREQMRRALVNLLDNAVAAVGEQGEVSVSIEYKPEAGLVQLEVADDGCGIDPEVRERIFEPYYSTKKDGTGLGLSIVSTIVTDHHGYIRVRPNEPRGTKFVIELPVRDAELGLIELGDEEPGERKRGAGA
ncbi:MAG TPA: ATP-binding protein [Candidatus Acidoferrales bacterium]|nr:ATP-binding protein [Candidatus Acidoferrales bacterium]